VARSLVLSLRLALARLVPLRWSQDGVEHPARPEGRVIWFHCQTPAALAGIGQLAEAMTQADPGLVTLATCADSSLPRAVSLDFVDLPPSAHPADIAAFLAHWRPSMAVWVEEPVWPSQTVAVRAQAIPLVALAARVDDRALRRLRWRRGMLRVLMESFTAILASDASSHRSLRKLGARPPVLERSTPLVEGAVALPCNEVDREALAALVAARPVWCAANVSVAEIAEVVEAHKAAAQRAHRLLLILAPASPEPADRLAEQLESEGWTVARRSNGQEPDPDVQIFLADVPGELGLWYRLAPITFVGQTLRPDGAPLSPMEPAALGSAIVHGPLTDGHAQAFARLGAAGAAQQAVDARGLELVLELLQAADQVAAMAHAAWEVSTAGVDLADRLIALVDAHAPAAGAR
jgi:3-deoxy-D-manno-octulosonic-acid transferase